MRKNIFLITIFGLILACGAGKQAAGAVNLRINNPKVRLNLPAGESKNGQITIENPTAQDIKVKCYLEDWFYTPGADGGKDFRPPGSTPLSCAPWISFSPAEFQLNPFGRQVINYVVKVPPGTQGGYYAVLFFETAIGEGTDEQGLTVLVLGRLGSLFYVEVADTIRREARLKDIEIKEQGQGYQIKALFENTGNADITAAGNFNLIDRSGMVFARGEFNQVYTFPQDQALIQGNWNKQIPPGIYDLIITLDLGGQAFVEERQVELGRDKVGVLE